MLGLCVVSVVATLLSAVVPVLAQDNSLDALAAYPSCAVSEAFKQMMPTLEH